MGVGSSSKTDEAAGAPRRPAFQAGLRRQLEKVHRWELAMVGSLRRGSDRGLLCTLAGATNRLGNGWLYPLLAVALLLSESRRGYLVLLTAGLAMGSAHTVYPWIKRKVARIRPFERAPHLCAGIACMDRYSFPSGHCMTSTAVAIPFAYGYPELAWCAVTVCLLIAWARMACAHHYLTDLVAGSALGAVMAFGSMALLQQLQLM